MRAGGAHKVIGYSHECPGGFGELMLLDEKHVAQSARGHARCARCLYSSHFPWDLSTPGAGRPEKGDVILVMGCGAIGLGVIAGLAIMGAGPIVAVDFHEDRRALAVAMGHMSQSIHAKPIRSAPCRKPAIALPT